MKIVMGSDHAGFDLKEELKAFVLELGHEVDDVGTHSTDSVDYPDYAEKVGVEIISGRADRASKSPRRSFMRGATVSLPKSYLPSLDPKSRALVNVPSATVAAQRHSHLRRFHLHPQGSDARRHFDKLDARQLYHGQRRSRTTRERWQRLGAAPSAPYMFAC